MLFLSKDDEADAQSRYLLDLSGGIGNGNRGEKADHCIPNHVI